MAERFTDSQRIAAVTGGNSGIGAECARAFAATGADVALLFHSDRPAADRLCSAIEGGGRRAIAVQGDVGDEQAVERFFDEVRARLGVADILVNSAGVNMSGIPVLDMPLEEWDRRIRSDLTGCFLTSRRFAADWRAAGKSAGAVINITSIHANVMRAGAAAYGAAKGGLKNLTETMALETAEFGLTVNAIAPGMILTPMNERAMRDVSYRRQLERNIPMKRAGRPEEVAAVAVFLASEQARYITGSTITIDGGLSLVLGQGA